METFLTITSIIGCIVLLGFAIVLIYCTVSYFRYSKFQRKLKPGNKCRFYLGHQRYCGTVSAFVDHYVIVVDSNGYPTSLYRSEVYPL